MFWRFLSTSLAAAVFLAFAVITWQSKVLKEQPRIILLTVESLRRDQVTPETAPHLLAAAETALQPETYRAVSGWTAANIVSLLTGLSPFNHGVHTRGQSIDPNLRLPLKQLSAQGYIVAGLQPFMAIDLYSNLGFTIEESTGDPRLWLAEKQRDDIPFFLWYHYLHTHLPYGNRQDAEQQHTPVMAPEQKKRLELLQNQAAVHFDEATYVQEDVPFIHQLQQENLREFDQWFGKFWDFLQKGGFLTNTILIVTADHGDEHGERGMVGHASTSLAGHLHREIVELPCYLWVPEKIQPENDTKVNLSTASHIDIMPTVFDLLGISSARPFAGTSLFQKTPDQDEWFGMTSSGGFSEPVPEEMRYFEYGYAADGWKSRLRIDRDGNQTHYLYDLNVDPTEQRDLAPRFPEIAKQHMEHLKPHIQDRTIRPILSSSLSPENLTGTMSDSPKWIRPDSSGIVTYDDLDGNFRLKWEGDESAVYLIEYRAGNGTKEISGTLKVEGTLKDFGKIERSYWSKWIVPLSPFRLRVRPLDGNTWSPWIVLDTRP